MYILEVITALILIVSIWIISFLRRRNKQFAIFPSPETVFFFGNALEFVSTKEVLRQLMGHARKFKRDFLLHMGPFEKVLIVIDYDSVEYILGSSKIIKKSMEYKFFMPWLGTGLLTSDGKKWQQHRKIITRAFHFQILEKFVNVFESQGNILVNKLSQIEDKTNLDIYQYVTLCALDVICESAMGTKVKAQLDSQSNYVRSVNEICRIIMERTSHLFKRYDFLFRFSTDFRIQAKCLKVLHDYTNKIVDSKRKAITEKSMDESEIRNKTAFLDLLLTVRDSNGKPLLSKEEIREEVDTFMFEGHDTTTSAISFTLYHIANDYKIQEKIVEEQRAIFGSIKNPDVTHAHLIEMKYLEMVIKEGLRMYPSVGVFGRVTEENVKLGDKIIPKGITLLLFPYAIHRNPKYFPDPEKFDPSRFEEIDGKTPFSYIPFSAGPRNCIGQKFAMLEMKCIISKIVRNFVLFPTNPAHNLQVLNEITLKSANGIRIGLKERKTQL